MKIETQKPNVVRLAYHQEKSDPNYGSCLWAYFDFDLDLYMLNVQSDCGNAAYRWHASPAESFLRLMSRIDDEDYLLEKFFRRSRVDVKATLNEIREWLGIGDDEDYRDDDLDDDDREKRENALEDLKWRFNEYSLVSTDAAAMIATEWEDENGFCIDCIYEHIVTDYTPGEKRIVQIFEDYIRPKIQEMVKGGEYA